MRAEETTTGRGEAAGSLLSALSTQMRLAASFLTILPVGPKSTASAEAVAASYACFPLVGFMLGAGLAAEDRMLGWVFGAVPRSILIVLSLTLVTGALHLDGLADSADALGARSDRARALEILRDSQIGPFGAVAIFFALALKCAALSSLQGWQRYVALYLAPGLGRWAMVAVSCKLDYLRARGAGTLLLRAADLRTLAAASALTVVAAAPFASMRAFTAICAAGAITAAMRWFYRRWLGGVTGDLIGAAGEIAEVAVLLAMAAFGGGA